MPLSLDVRMCSSLCHGPGCRLLNALPATRLTATALDAFLQVAGHRLYGAYGRQFVKLLHCVDDEFLGDLRKVRGVVSAFNFRVRFAMPRL